MLQSGALGAVAVHMGAALTLLDRASAANGEPRIALDASEARVLEHLAERLCPAAGGGAPGAKELDLVGTIDAALAGAEPDLRDGVKLALSLFESAAVGMLLGERVRAFTALSHEEQDRAIDDWRFSGIAFRRSVMRGLSSLVMSMYWGERRVWERTGYPGPPDPAALRATYRANLVDLAALSHTERKD